MPKKRLKDDNVSSEQRKSRLWAFCVYPESMPENWIEVLTLTGLKIAISPLHDKDLKADNIGEEAKKAHYHVILTWESGTATFSMAKRIADSVNGSRPIALNNLRGYYRYLTHKDNPEKYQYDEKDIKCLNGFSIDDYVELTKSEVNKIKRELVEIVLKNGFTEYCDLVNYCMIDLLDDGKYWEVVTNHTVFFNAYVKSLRYKKKGNK